MKWVGVQRDQFKRLGVSGDWENPYLTLDPRYEAGILDVLADLVERGSSTASSSRSTGASRPHRPGRGRAGVPRRDVAEHLRQFPDGVGRARPPGARALARHDLDDDALDPAGQPRHRRCTRTSTTPASGTSTPTPAATVHTILAAELVGRVHGARERRRISRRSAACTGRDLEHARYRHPSSTAPGRWCWPTMSRVEDGTGLVHTAPGHGAEDYQTGQKYGLPILSPVDAARPVHRPRRPTDVVGEQVFEANPKIVELLRDRGRALPSSCRCRTATRTAGGARSR